MERIKIIIIDDNLAFLRSFEAMVANIDMLNLVCSCSNIEDAYTAIVNFSPDLIFLDVKLKNKNGFDLLTRFEKINFEVVITSAYSEYAIDAFSYSVLHYLLKPFGTLEIYNALDRYRLKLQHLNINQESPELNGTNSQMLDILRLHTMDGLTFVNYQEIIYCKSDNNYTTFFKTNQERITVSVPLKKFENLLKHAFFARIHQSYLVNLKHVQKLSYKEGLTLYLTNNISLPVSRRKKQYLIESLTKLSIH